jgi:hypothetical protein
VRALKNFVGGKCDSASSEETNDYVNMASSEVVARILLSTRRAEWRGIFTSDKPKRCQIGR